MHTQKPKHTTARPENKNKRKETHASADTLNTQKKNVKKYSSSLVVAPTTYKYTAPAPAPAERPQTHGTLRRTNAAEKQGRQTSHHVAEEGIREIYKPAGGRLATPDAGWGRPI